jgi:hypothetical protein
MPLDAAIRLRFPDPPNLPFCQQKNYYLFGILAVTSADVQAVIARYVAGRPPIVAIAQSPQTQASTANTGGAAANGIKQ